MGPNSIGMEAQQNTEFHLVFTLQNKLLCNIVFFSRTRMAFTKVLVLRNRLAQEQLNVKKKTTQNLFGGKRSLFPCMSRKNLYKLHLCYCYHY